LSAYWHKHGHPDLAVEFVKAVMHRRGVLALVEREELIQHRRPAEAYHAALTYLTGLLSLNRDDLNAFIINLSHEAR
jgi:hypothetical protein